MRPAERRELELEQRREALALHVDAAGYPNAAAVIREFDDLDAGGKRARARGRAPLEELPEPPAPPPAPNGPTPTTGGPR